MSDLHGTQFFTRPGDLLVIAGDLTATGSVQELSEMQDYLSGLDFKKKIIIGGNHDIALANATFQFDPEIVTYLNDSGCTYAGYKIWGSPWVSSFKGMNPKCKAFTMPKTQLKKMWDLIPEDTDILVTHNPPLGHLDGVMKAGRYEEQGCPFLLKRIKKIFPKFHLFGHIHEGGGQFSLEKNSLSGKQIELRNCAMFNPTINIFNRPTYITI